MLVVGLVGSSALAQKLPPPSRTVYKCQDAGRTVYTDSPCMAAERIEVQPTRGLNQTTGKELIGRDVRHEQHREMMADALRPLTGMDATQLDRAGRRRSLTPAAQRECQHLDRELPGVELAERRGEPGQLKAVQRRLLVMRSRFREIGCV
ncbi:DUF4124 domain-containing protein [Ideonella sp. A 288]|uniref:DUF4124 domain-containing protein n=1 Tax=Ideonella sp. A 288 TaxID=1962181 RepID=UPI001303C1AC|nr:DUF4124 domain-containing protein [Ideonella sp. A 288]